MGSGLGNGSLLVAKSPHEGGTPFSPREHRDQPKGSPSLKAKYARRKYGRSAQSGRTTTFCSSSAAPRWSKRKLRSASRSTSCSAFQLGAASSGASNRCSIQAEYRFSYDGLHCARVNQSAVRGVPGTGPGRVPTAISCVARSAAGQAASRARVACHAPAAGASTRAIHE